MNNIESSDVIRLILQFLQENNLTTAYDALRKESQVNLNTVSDPKTILDSILKGRWDQVLVSLQQIELPAENMMDLYEHVAFEMIETKENDLAHQLLIHSIPLCQLKDVYPMRYRQLEFYIKESTEFRPKTVYPSGSRDKRRQELANDLKTHLKSVLPSRLLTLLSQSLKYQEQKGILPAGTSHDFFRGGAKRQRIDREDKPPRRTCGRIKFNKKSTPQCATFSPNGQMIVSGSLDGFIEVWDIDTCKLRKDLDYQQKEKFMMHEKSVMCVEFAKDADLLASGSIDGQVKVWSIATGTCLRRLDHAHRESVSSIRFGFDNTRILTASHDRLIRLHGLKSGQALKEFRGHESHVYVADFYQKETQVMSCSADGTVKVWEIKTSACLQTLRPSNSIAGVQLDILSIVPFTYQTTTAAIVIATRSNQLDIVSIATGDSLATWKYEKESEYGQLVGTTKSLHEKFIYGLTEHGYLLCFNAQNGTLESQLQVSGKDVYGLSHHPLQNLIATFGFDNSLRFWQS